MISVAGYSNLQIIHQSPETLVYSARRNRDGEKVVLRQLRPEVAAPGLVAQYRKEYELLTSISSPFVIKAEGLIEQNTTPILVTEHIGGDSLTNIMRREAIPTRDAVKIGIAITSGLDHLHGHHIIHKDINPSNIIFNEETGQVRIIDLGISSELSNTTVRVDSTGALEGTLAYLAPEQTGRMNRTVDYRADFYALGATLYELLTGEPPFQTDEPLQMVYNHIAATPIPPCEKNTAIPLPLSQIVMKLLAKMPEDRYQSAHAIKQDFSRCLEIIDQRAGSDRHGFEVALDDVPDQLNISERLLERERQSQELKDHLAAVARGGTEVVVCTGEAGVGKSSLIREFQKDVTSYGGYLVTGKHSIMSAEKPYSAVSGACTDLVRQLLSRPDIEDIRQRILAAIDGTADVLVELVPELRLIIGEVAAAPDNAGVAPLEQKARLIKGLSGLFRVVASERKPFVISLENLQWIDPASIELFDPLVTHQKIPYFMLVCAYRTRELATHHETRRAMESLIQGKARIKLIRLANLGARSIATIISDSLYRPLEETLKFADLVHTKTNGNPLAIREFLNDLNRKGLLKFDRDHREWFWDMAAAKEQPPTDNVSALLAERIAHLEPVTAHLLKIASCAGDEFDLDTVRNVSQLSFSETSARLLHAVREGYLVFKPQNQGRDSERRIRYQFSHERIQQAAYTLLTTTQRRKIHTSIGHSFLKHREASEDNIFEIVNQLNNSFESPESSFVDKNKLAELNLAAGRKAKHSAAFQSSFKYFKTAIALYGQNVWAQYELSLQMHIEAAETAYLCGDHKQLELLVDRTLKHAKNPLDQSRIYEIKLRALIAFNELDAALTLGHQVLELLDVPLKPIRSIQGLVMLLRLLYQTARINESEVASARAMDDPRLLAAMRVLMILCQAGYLTGSNNTGLYILRMTQLSLRYGMAPESSFAYPMFGAVLIAYLGKIDSGYRFGMLASNNLDASNKDLHCKTITLVNNFISSWKSPLKETLEPLTNAYRIGLETGDIEFALIAAITSSANAFLLGHDLNSLDANLTGYNQKASEYNQTPILSAGSIYQQSVQNLINPNKAPWLLEGDVYSEKELLPFHEDSGDESSIVNLYVLKTFLALLFNNHEDAIVFAKEARSGLSSIGASPVVPFFVAYESLACIAGLGTAGTFERFALHRRLRRNRRLLRKWAHHSPENVLHACHLVEAELCRVRGDETQALAHYEQAISLAAEHGYLKEHGFASELAGRFHIASGRRDLGLFYVRRARASFVRWGAMAKVSALDIEFTDMAAAAYAEHGPREGARSRSASFSPNYRNYGNSLDLGSVIKASQVLSGEIILDSLLERLMQVALENAGANSASLVLANEGELSLEITTTYNGSVSEHTRDGGPVTEATTLPVSVIQYVARTQEDLVLNDACNEDIFTQDEYIISRQPKSILCIPILSKSHLTGVLYLENLQSTLAFTQDRVAILKLLASQSAIAIENAKLYQQLNESRDKYLSLYQNAVEGIFELDHQGIITNINPAAAQLLGYDEAEPGQKQPAFKASDTLINPQDAEILTEILTRDKRVVGYEMQIRRKDGQALWVAISAQVFFDDEQETHYRIEGSVIDITERKLREDAEQATRLAEAATESKSQFLANMSHEIRTPMNAIVGYTDLALRTDLTEQQMAYLETIRNSSSHLLRVVNDILDISKVESGKLELQKVPFKLSEIFKDLHSLFGLEASERGLLFNVPDPRSLDDVYFLGDPVRIGQVLINLVSNALKFTDAGEIKVEFEPIALQDGRICINFAVSDTGIGIEASQLDYIFESFVQGNIQSKYSGTGLGLAICKSIVEMMDGHIHATSVKDNGSSFYFSVVVEAWDQAHVPEVSIKSTQDRSMAGRNILLVEDNRINQDLAAEVLTHAGLSVHVAENGQQALDLLERESYFAVLMDLRMPVMDGIEAIKHIRANDALHGLRVIALSAGVLKTEVEEAFAAGFDHYLSKPVDFEELLDLLNAVSMEHSPEERGEIIAPLASLPASVEVHGVDFGTAIRNHAGDEVLLTRLMGDFIEIYEKADAELRGFIENGELVQAERLSHNIAGVSGSFGAIRLMETSRVIEHRLIAGETDLAEALRDFSRELENFVDAIKLYRIESGRKPKIQAL